MINGGSGTSGFLAMGASGSSGLSQMIAVLRSLPEDIDAAVLVVLHRPFDRTSRLREVLAASSRLPVAIPDHGEKLQPGRCYLGEPARHLALAAGGVARLIDDPLHRLRNRTVDTLFRSVAEHGTRRAMGVVLAGSLDDGSRGLAAIETAGGRAGVLLSGSAGRWSGMPENALDHCREALVARSAGGMAEMIGDYFGVAAPADAAAARGVLMQRFAVEENSVRPARAAGVS
jgi:two-component system, chemotaxis family, protein-glutamate methylesterase/glutaminase